jgi:hypothetical protein
MFKAFEFCIPRPGFKALLALWSLNRGRKKRPNWDRIVIIASTTLTLNLFALYVYGKLTARLELFRLE